MATLPLSIVSCLPPTYAEQLAEVLRSGGWVHLLEISEKIPEHPSITTAEILEAFDHRWQNAQVVETTYRVTTGDVPAWQVSMRRA